MSQATDTALVPSAATDSVVESTLTLLSAGAYHGDVGFYHDFQLSLLNDVDPPERKTWYFTYSHYGLDEECEGCDGCPTCENSMWDGPRRGSARITEIARCSMLEPWVPPVGPAFYAFTNARYKPVSGTHNMEEATNFALINAASTRHFYSDVMTGYSKSKKVPLWEVPAEEARSVMKSYFQQGICMGEKVPSECQLGEERLTIIAIRLLDCCANNPEHGLIEYREPNTRSLDWRPKRTEIPSVDMTENTSEDTAENATKGPAKDTVAGSVKTWLKKKLTIHP